MIIVSKLLNSSIWFINETLTGTTIPGQSEVIMTMKGYFAFPKAPGLEPNHQVQFSVTHRVNVGGVHASIEVQLAYSTAPADREGRHWSSFQRIFFQFLPNFHATTDSWKVFNFSLFTSQMHSLKTKSVDILRKRLFARNRFQQKKKRKKEKKMENFIHFFKITHQSWRPKMNSKQDFIEVDSRKSWQEIISFDLSHYFLFFIGGI